jgi:uncharacterized membrane protein YGL010W
MLRRNKWIHIIFVPVIAATLFCGLSYIPFHVTLLDYDFGVAELFFAIALLYYISINILFAAGFIVLSFVIAYGWKQAFSEIDSDTFFKWIVIVHVVAWIFQFIGHGVFESISEIR